MKLGTTPFVWDPVSIGLDAIFAKWTDSVRRTPAEADQRQQSQSGDRLQRSVQLLRQIVTEWADMCPLG